uniref:HAT C-terminal dimerisation domain-containing protein n=1 Tax=Nothobranchius korthausae TaxID=1143690 RepID=A0A1A8HGQ5_9TELE
MVMSEESVPTLSVIAPLHAKLMMGAQESHDDTATVRDIKAAIAEDLGKDTPVEEENVAEDAHINDSCASISQPPLKRPRTSCALVDLLGATFPSTSSDNTEPKSENELAAGEIQKYRGEAPLPLTENPLSWWKNHEQDYPQLSKIAKSLLCIPGTSVSAERVFSSAGDIVTAQRSLLKAEHVDQLVFLHKNLEI